MAIYIQSVGRATRKPPLVVVHGPHGVGKTVLKSVEPEQVSPSYLSRQPKKKIETVGDPRQLSPTVKKGSFNHGDFISFD